MAEIKVFSITGQAAKDYSGGMKKKRVTRKKLGEDVPEVPIDPDVPDKPFTPEDPDVPLAPIKPSVPDVPDVPVPPPPETVTH